MAQGMNKLNEALASLPEVRELLLSLDAGTSPIAVSGLSGVHRTQLTAAVRHKTQDRKSTRLNSSHVAIST